MLNEFCYFFPLSQVMTQTDHGKQTACVSSLFQCTTPKRFLFLPLIFSFDLTSISTDNHVLHNLHAHHVLFVFCAIFFLRVPFSWQGLLPSHSQVLSDVVFCSWTVILLLLLTAFLQHSLFL